MSEDFPTFDRPEKATAGRSSGSGPRGFTKLPTNSTVLIFMRIPGGSTRCGSALGVSPVPSGECGIDRQRHLVGSVEGGGPTVDFEREQIQPWFPASWGFVPHPVAS